MSVLEQVIYILIHESHISFEASFTGVGRGGVDPNPSDDDDSSSYNGTDGTGSYASVASSREPTPSPSRKKVYPTRSSVTPSRGGIYDVSKSIKNTFPTGVHVSKKRYQYGGVDGYYFAITCILPSGLVTDNRKDTLMKANSQVKAKIVNSKCGLIEITIPKPKSFFKMQTFKTPSPIITHFFAQDNDAFKEMIGASFEYDRELMHEMHSDIKMIRLNEEIDENIKVRGCSYIPTTGIALFTMLVKAREQKILSDDEGEDAILFACGSNPHSPAPSGAPNQPYQSPNPAAQSNTTSSAAPPPPSQQAHRQQPSPNNLSREEADQAFQAVANELNRRNLESQRLARELEVLMERLEQVEASSPSSSRRRRVSSSNNQAVPPQTSSANVQEPMDQL